MIDPSRVLAGLPKALRDEVLKCYQEIMSNYLERRWEPSELNGGKFCEAVYSIVYGAVKGNFPAKASKPARMLDACQALEKEPANASRVGDRSLRVLIPRTLPVLYEVRNNRGVGHVGGDVDANHMDAEFVQATASWVMAELIASRLANVPRCLIGIEAGMATHYVARELIALGHDVRQVPPAYARPFRQAHKNDFRDAYAIAEAVQRPSTRFVPVKTDDQLDLQALHRVRSRLISERTAVINQIRGFLLEHGIPVRQGLRFLRQSGRYSGLEERRSE